MLPAALFRSDELHERDITLGDGTVHKLNFREMTREQEMKYRELVRTDGDHVTYMIACSLCDADGKLIDEEQAGRLKRGVRNAMVSAILDINGADTKMGNALPPAEKTGSSTS